MKQDFTPSRQGISNVEEAARARRFEPRRGLLVGPLETNSDTPRLLYLAQVVGRGLGAVVHVRCDLRKVGADELAEVGDVDVLRCDEHGEISSAFLRSGDALVWIGFNRHGQDLVEVACEDEAAARTVALDLKRRWAKEPPGSDSVSVAFWAGTQYGAEPSGREIEAPEFEALAGNYPGDVRLRLEALIRAPNLDSGKLMSATPQ